MNQMGNLEKLGILVIVILVVVVGVVAITPSDRMDSVIVPEEQVADAPQEPVDPVQPGPQGPEGWPLPAADGKTPVPPVPQGGGNLVADVPPGPMPAPAPVPAPTPAAEFGEYVVQKGDTGESISMKVLGKRTGWSEIAALNPGVSANKLRVGQKLKVPNRQASASTPAPVPGPAPSPIAENPPFPVPPSPVVPPAPQPEPAPAPAAERTYVVRNGDTLSDIARREMGSASKWPELKSANADVLRGSDSVRPGMKLRIPGSSGGTVARGTTVRGATPAPTVETGATTYTVRKGDTLTSIAARMLGSQSRWREIMSANSDKLSSPEKLAVGMVLRMPTETQAR